jgi:hypothetical protein
MGAATAAAPATAASLAAAAAAAAAATAAAAVSPLRTADVAVRVCRCEHRLARLEGSIQARSRSHGCILLLLLVDGVGAGDGG